MKRNWKLDCIFRGYLLGRRNGFLMDALRELEKHDPAKAAEIREKFLDGMIHEEDRMRVGLQKQLGGES